MRKDYDVAVIGGGVIGCAVARELSRRKLRICLIEKGEDVCSGTSKANSGIVHAGFDAKPGTMKAKMNLLGSRMMPHSRVGDDVHDSCDRAVAVEDGARAFYDFDSLDVPYRDARDVRR